MDDDELEAIRRRKMAQIQNQAVEAQRQQEAQKEMQAQKQAAMRKILSTEARSRLENIRMVRPEFAAQLELQLLQLAQTGQLARIGNLPLSDNNFKMILSRLSGKSKDIKIKRI